MPNRPSRKVLAILGALVSAGLLNAQTTSLDPRFLSGLVWRNVGPFRAGRVAAVSGVIGQAGVFYIGLPAGGVWKTTSAGQTWYPVFDSVKSVSSIGALEVAPSEPNTIYVGTGDMITGNAINEGNGVWKSTDAGRTWRHLGLDGTKQIPSILVDPRDANTVMIAAQGDIHEKNDTRGVYRSTDGGATWTKTLYVDDETGIQKLARANDVPNVVFATTVHHYNPRGAAPRRFFDPDTGATWTKIFKSTDAGVTWSEIAGHGLPRLTGRTSIAVAMNTNAQRVYFITNTGLYRSDDGGGTWRRMDESDRRIANGQGGYNCGVYVDPKNPDVVYTFNTAAYKSTDGGNTFTGFRGAPGGDDPQQMWIDPTDGQRMIMGYDQGAIVSLDGGANWSSWYNQSTEQVYHISTDNSFPYWIYASQQDAGAIATRSRGNLGEITPLDWKPVPTWEWGTVVADPDNPNVVYGSGNGIVKVTWPSELWIDVSPAADPAMKARVSSSQPLVWSRWNGKRELLAGMQYVMSTTDGGATWTKLSPDLTVTDSLAALIARALTAQKGASSGEGAPRPPEQRDTTTPQPTGAIESISASTATPGVIWVGSNTGMIHVTRDHGRTWRDVTPAGLPFANVAGLVAVEASQHDPGEAYAAITFHTRGDYAPYVYRTRDYGKTWTKIVNGLPASLVSGAFVRVVRADVQRRGLLFAGTESGVYVSFDDGDSWQSLQLNLPNTSYRDMTIHGSDLVAGTYGRGVWILDDITPLRQITPAVASESAHLFAPGDAVRLRRNVGQDTPFPPDVPHARNAPTGMFVYYTLGAAPRAPVTLEVLDSTGTVIRHLTSAPQQPVPEAAQPPEPNFWIAPPYSIPADVGLDRAVWDLRYDPPKAFTHTFEINANPGETPPSPEGALVLPGRYTLRLTVDGKTYTQTGLVRPDPRSPATMAALAAQHGLLMQLTRGLDASWSEFQSAAALRARLDTISRASGVPDAITSAAKALVARIDSLAGNPSPRRGFGGRGGSPTFVSVNAELVNQLNAQDAGDMSPTPAARAAAKSACAELAGVEQRWKGVATDLANLNHLLSAHGIATVAAPAMRGRGC